MSQMEAFAWVPHWNIWDSTLIWRYWLVDVCLLAHLALFLVLKLYVVRKICGPVAERQAHRITANGPTKNGPSANGHTVNGFLTKSSQASEPELSDADCSDIAAKVISFLITVFVSTASMYAMYETAHNVVTSRSKTLNTTTHIGACYFLFDIYAMYDTLYLRRELWKTSVPKRVWIFVNKRGLFLIHHLALIVLGYPLVVNAAWWRRNLGDFIIAAFFIRELSNPLMMVAQILKILNLQHTKVAIYSAICGLFLFFMVRIANTPLVILYYAYQHFNGHLLSALMTLRPICVIVIVLEMGLEIFWFRALTKLILRTISAKAAEEKKKQ